VQPPSGGDGGADLGGQDVGSVAPQVDLDRDLCACRGGLPRRASSLAISLDMADLSSRPGSSASIRSATSSALASSTASRNGRPMDSAWLTTISPPSYDRSIGQ